MEYTVSMVDNIGLPHCDDLWMDILGGVAYTVTQHSCQVSICQAHIHTRIVPVRLADVDPLLSTPETITCRKLMGDNSNIQPHKQLHLMVKSRSSLKSSQVCKVQNHSEPQFTSSMETAEDRL